MEIAITLLILVTWASHKTLEKIIPKLNESLQKVSESTWINLYNSVEDALDTQQYSRRDVSLDVNHTDEFLNSKTAVLMCLRAEDETRKLLYSKYLEDYDALDVPTLKLCYNMSLEFLASDYSMWDKVRNVIQRSYAKGVVFERYAFHRFSREINSQNIPYEIAEEIASCPRAYPGFLVAIAEMKIKEKVASKVIPVGETAINEKWFYHL
jgi:hypothetical protein